MAFHYICTDSHMDYPTIHNTNYITIVRWGTIVFMGIRFIVSLRIPIELKRTTNELLRYNIFSRTYYNWTTNVSITFPRTLQTEKKTFETKNDTIYFGDAPLDSWYFGKNRNKFNQKWEFLDFSQNRLQRVSWYSAFD